MRQRRPRAAYGSHIYSGRLLLRYSCWLLRRFGTCGGGVQFHESWTEAQRAELLELDACLLAAPMRALVIDEISEDGDEEDEETSETEDEEDEETSETEDEEDEETSETEDEEDEETCETEDEEDEDFLKSMEKTVRAKSNFPWLYLRKSIELRDRFTHARRNLKETAAKGYQPNDQRHTTVAHLAARFGKAALLRELVKRGADPNARDDDDPMQRSVFCTAIAGLPYADRALLPVQEKLDLLDFLLSYGVDVSENMIGALNAVFDADEYDKIDKSRILQWLLTHGIIPQTVEDWRDIAYSLTAGAQRRELIQSLIQQGILNPGNDALPYLLNGLLENAVYGDNVEHMLLWLLDDLHVDPNAPLSLETKKTSTVISYYVSELTEHRELSYSSNNDVARHLNYLKILLDHGARLSPKEINALRPKNKKQRAQFEAVIKPTTF